MGVSRRVLISQLGNMDPGALTVPDTGARVAIGVGRLTEALEQGVKTFQHSEKNKC